jgi:hypothetical protein
MRIGDILFFSPGYAFRDLDFENHRLIATAFHDRVRGFYLDAAEHLVATKHAFGAGLLVCSAIDFIAATCSEEEPEKFLTGFLHVEDRIARALWIQLRHGLVHEGRVKPFGEFSFEAPKMADWAGDAFIVNPALLVHQTKKSLDGLCASFSAQRKQLLAERLRHRFHPEVDAARNWIGH